MLGIVVLMVTMLSFVNCYSEFLSALFYCFNSFFRLIEKLRQLLLMIKYESYQIVGHTTLVICDYPVQQAVLINQSFWTAFTGMTQD